MNLLLETGAISEVSVTTTGLEPTTTYFVNEYLTIQVSIDKYSQHSSIIWSVWLDGWVFVYELSGCGFESLCSYLDLLCFLRPPFCARAGILNLSSWINWKWGWGGPIGLKRLRNLEGRGWRFSRGRGETHRDTMIFVIIYFVVIICLIESLRKLFFQWCFPLVSSFKINGFFQGRFIRFATFFCCCRVKVSLNIFCYLLCSSISFLTFFGYLRYSNWK